MEQLLLLNGRHSGRGRNQKQALRIAIIEKDGRNLLSKVARTRDPHYYDPETCHGFTITRVP